MAGEFPRQAIPSINLEAPMPNEEMVTDATIPRTMDKTASRVSDERLADLMSAETPLVFTVPEIRRILTELQSLRSLSSESVSDGSKGVRLDGPELWEVVFGIMKGDVPEELTEEVFSQIAVAINQAFALDSGTGGQQPVAYMWRWIYAVGRTGPWNTCLAVRESRPLTSENAGMEVVPLYSSPTEPKAGVATHRHKKRGSEYVLLGFGKMQTGDWQRMVPNIQDGAPGYTMMPADMHEVAIYRSVDDGSLWVRPREEFEDGRFETLQPSKGE
jgi:hypothetical protein